MSNNSQDLRGVRRAPAGRPPRMPSLSITQLLQYQQHHEEQYHRLHRLQYHQQMARQQQSQHHGTQRLPSPPSPSTTSAHHQRHDPQQAFQAAVSQMAVSPMDKSLAMAAWIQARRNDNIGDRGQQETTMPAISPPQRPQHQSPPLPSQQQVQSPQRASMSPLLQRQQTPRELLRNSPQAMTQFGSFVGQWTARCSKDDRPTQVAGGGQEQQFVRQKATRPPTAVCIPIDLMDTDKAEPTSQTNNRRQARRLSSAVNPNTGRASLPPPTPAFQQYQPAQMSGQRRQESAGNRLTTPAVVSSFPARKPQQDGRGILTPTVTPFRSARTYTPRASRPTGQNNLQHGRDSPAYKPAANRELSVADVLDAPVAKPSNPAQVQPPAALTYQQAQALSTSRYASPYQQPLVSTPSPYLSTPVPRTSPYKVASAPVINRAVEQQQAGPPPPRRRQQKSQVSLSPPALARTVESPQPTSRMTPPQSPGARSANSASKSHAQAPVTGHNCRQRQEDPTTQAQPAPTIPPRPDRQREGSMTTAKFQEMLLEHISHSDPIPLPENSIEEELANVPRETMEKIMYRIAGMGDKTSKSDWELHASPQEQAKAKEQTHAEMRANIKWVTTALRDNQYVAVAEVALEQTISGAYAHGHIRRALFGDLATYKAPWLEESPGVTDDEPAAASTTEGGPSAIPVLKRKRDEDGQEDAQPASKKQCENPGSMSPASSFATATTVTIVDEPSTTTTTEDAGPSSSPPRKRKGDSSGEGDDIQPVKKKQSESLGRESSSTSTTTTVTNESTPTTAPARASIHTAKSFTQEEAEHNKATFERYKKMTAAMTPLELARYAQLCNERERETQTWNEWKRAMETPDRVPSVPTNVATEVRRQMAEGYFARQ